MTKLLNGVISIVIAISIILSFSGCFIPRSYSLPGKNEQEIIDNQLAILIDAIGAKDTDAIINMFSREALAEIESEGKFDAFEDSIEELIETFPDWDGAYDGYNDMTVREYIHNSRDNTSYRCYMPDIEFSVGEADYQFHLVIIYHADEEERLGLRAIQICDGDISDYESEGYYRKPGLEVFPGVYCWDCDIAQREEKYR